MRYFTALRLQLVTKKSEQSQNETLTLGSRMETSPGDGLPFPHRLEPERSVKLLQDCGEV